MSKCRAVLPGADPDTLILCVKTSFIVSLPADLDMIRRMPCAPPTLI